MGSAPRLASPPGHSHLAGPAANPVLAQDKVPVWSQLPAGKVLLCFAYKSKTCELLVPGTLCFRLKWEKGESCQIQLVSAPGADGGLAQQRVFTNCPFPEYTKQSSED